MKMRRIWVCDICGKEFDSSVKAQSHEASCYGLDDAGYRTWLSLAAQSARSGKVLYYQNNPETRERFDAACKKLASFEMEHHLENVRKPSDWYL